MINDLKSKVSILERELKIINENADKEVEHYKNEVEALRGQKIDEELNKDMIKHYEHMSL